MGLRSLAAGLTGSALRATTWLLTGARARWLGIAPGAGPRIYFANHSSHIDFVLIWSLIPPEFRSRTRPVAAGDYWLEGTLRRFLIRDVFRGVCIDRRREHRTEDPVAQMADALCAGDALILFPEGTRNLTDDTLLPFRSGLFHLARRRPEADLVPVWIENLNRVMPKGEALPVPLLCGVSFGEPLHLAHGEPKDAFLERARDALLALRPQ